MKPYKKANIFNTQDYELIVKRIHSLTDGAQAQWGIMNLAEMLEHCTIQLKMALFEIKGAKNEGSFILRTMLGRWVGLYGPKWQKGAITPSQMNVKKQSIGNEPTTTKISTLLLYLEKVRKQEKFQAHPLFGELNKEDWGRLIWKHLDHHLSQFGA
ncbi:MAG: DUF1569 domain-containing protein [Cytophagales bacterium]|nr:MAG: DUF1569 domain-containing protein [Cytophagales bacterium]